MSRVTLSWPTVSCRIVHDYDEIMYCQASFEDRPDSSRSCIWLWQK